jgi:hypothetical protein
MSDLAQSLARAKAGSARPRQRIELSEIQNPLVRDAFNLWSKLKGARRLPARSDFSPRDMKGFLRNAVLVRVLDRGREFQFRIVGDAIVSIQGASFQGLTTAEVDIRLPGYGAMLKHVYCRVCDERAPRAFRGWFEHAASQRAFFHESVTLPLGADGETVDHILIVGIYAFGHEGAPG